MSSWRWTPAALLGAALSAIWLPVAVPQPVVPDLDLAVVVAFDAPPLLTLDGTPSEDAARTVRWMTEALNQLLDGGLRDVPISVALSPVLCDELVSSTSPDARRVRTLFRDLAARAPVLLRPYADVRLPDLEDFEIAPQIELGRTTLTSCSAPGSAPSEILFPPDLRLDGRLVGAGREVCDACVVVASGLAPAESLGSTPARVGRVELVPARLVEPTDVPNDVLLRFAAQRVAAAVVSAERDDLGTFIAGLANDPRVRLRPLSELTGGSRVRSSRFPPADDPPRTYRRGVERARRSFDQFLGYTLGDNPQAAVFRTALARARSTAEWDGDWSVGTRRAARLASEIARQAQLITAAAGSVTFTSQRGSVPVTVTNAATYPVRLRVELSSSKLSFPDGASRVVVVDPPGDTIVFSAFARSTGTFPVLTRVTSPDRAVRFHAGEVTVRSTAANVSAVVLTSGGAVFLLAWGFRHRRRRRDQREAG